MHINVVGHFDVVMGTETCVVLSSADSCRNIYIYILDTYRRNDKDAGRLLYKYIVPLTLFVRVRKGYLRFACERELETEQKLQYFDLHSYGRQRCVFLVLQGCSTGGPGAHSAGWWLPLLHLISNFSGPQFIRAPSPFGLMWLSLPHLTPAVCNSTGPWLPSWLRYIIIQRPHDRPLDLWNRMFNRHQAGITVKQFTGHSFPVHQSMSVPWEFF